jgi:hypothetical protein
MARWAFCWCFCQSLTQTLQEAHEVSCPAFSYNFCRCFWHLILWSSTCTERHHDSDDQDVSEHLAGKHHSCLIPLQHANSNNNFQVVINLVAAGWTLHHRRCLHCHQWMAVQTTACVLNKNATWPFVWWIHSSTFARIMCRQGGRYSAI